MSDCIEWLWSRNSYGYGRLGGGRRGVTLFAHRATWEQVHGPIPPGMIVMHTCDNPPCVNIDHLRLSTMQDNTQDMMRKGRGRYIAHRGEANATAKLTEELVREIRASSESPSEIAARLNIHKSNVWLIRRRKTWTHVQ